jgi:formylglycine-generating enzyme
MRCTLPLLFVLLALGGLAPACTEAAAQTSGSAAAADGGTAQTTLASLTSATLDAGLSLGAQEACPEGMVLVEGDYCPNVEQTCLRYRDPPVGPYAYFRCDEYKKPAKCLGKRVHKRFCIDAVEHVEPGTDLPMNKKSWTDATRVCEAEGARLCMTSEWQFACEGEEMRPYPYGWERDSTACNVDIERGLGRVGKLVDHRTPASAHPRCVSPFGVHDMSGNVDEWATVDGAPRGAREVMKGSWWMPGRHACRQFQGGHGSGYGGTESGVRCCKDAPAGQLAAR